MDSVTMRRMDPEDEREEQRKEYVKLLQDEDFRSMFGELIQGKYERSSRCWFEPKPQR